MNLLWVGLGGALGSVLRYAFGSWVTLRLSQPTFPWGTLVINLLGCLLIGITLSLAKTHFADSAWIIPFVSVGLLGGFTTFSAFGFEAQSLFTAGRADLALIYIASSVIGGVAAVSLGKTFTA